MREPKMKPIKVECLQEIKRNEDIFFDGELVGKSGVVLFQKGKHYPVTFYRDFMMSALNEEGDWDVIADDKTYEGIWSTDEWFNERFKMIFE